MLLNELKLFRNTRIDLSKIEIVEFPHNFTIELEDGDSKYVGIVLEGRINVKAYSLAGKNFTINTMGPGQMFGDVLIFGSSAKTYPGSLITKGKTKIAKIPNYDFEQYLFYDNDFLKNFLELLSDKAFEMNVKSKMLSQDSVRDKILFYLFQQKKLQKSKKIKLNMTKEELANVLYMQRPSLSRELIKMKQDGLIDYDRWTITLLK